ncbi:MAG TPA: hypothetical protein PLI95_09905 [Polyangiaceae bacterium]|nr:hypothetical protein [Polyangiaceae bacterium]
MTHDDRIDLSSLDPSRDADRWENIVQSIASRAAATRRRQMTIPYQLSRWALPVLAAAASLTLLIWTGALLSGGRNGATASNASSASPNASAPAYELAQWAVQEELPSTERILEVLGGSHGSK